MSRTTLLLFLIWSCLVTVCSAQSGGGFIDQLTPAERQALRVDEMSPEALALLESAARRYAGRPESKGPEVSPDLETALAQTRAQLAQAESELAEAKATHEKEMSEKNKGSLLDRAMVLLTPGTKVEFSTVESKLTKPFRGWKVGTLFYLENGQVWRVTSGSYSSPPEDAGKAVTIVPGTLGSFFIKIDGVRQSPKVEIVSR